MATLGQYRKAQTQTGAAAESGLQALMLLMQYMQQREDRKDEREWRGIQIERQRLDMDRLRQEIRDTQPGVGTFLSISDVRDGNVYSALDDLLDDMGTITSNPEKAQIPIVVETLKSPTGKKTALVAESDGIPQGPWAKAWQKTLELRAALEETISDNVDPAEREQLLQEIDTKITKSMGVDDTRFGVLSQEALAALLRQEAWKDGYSFDATTYEWMRAKHGDDPLISRVLELDKEKGPRWTFADKVNIEQAQREMLDGGVGKLLRDMSKGEGGRERTSAIDIAVMEKLPDPLRQKGREIFFREGQQAFIEFAEKHAPREPGFFERQFDIAQTIIEENPATAVVGAAGTGYAAWIGKRGLWQLLKGSGFGAAALAGSETVLRAMQEGGILEGEGAFIDNAGEFGGEGTLVDMVQTAMGTPDPTGEVSGVEGEAPGLLDLLLAGFQGTADDLAGLGVFPHQWEMFGGGADAPAPALEAPAPALEVPAPTLDDLVAGEETMANRIDPGEGLGPPAPPPPPTGMPAPYQTPPGTPEMTPEMMLQMLGGEANAPFAGMGSPPVPQTLGTTNRELWPVPANVPYNTGPQPATLEERSAMHGLAPTRGGDVQLEKKFMELQELLEPGSQYRIPTDPFMNPETGREMWPVPAGVPYGQQFMGMPMEELQASDQAYETIAAEAQKEHEVNMFMQAMAQKNAIQEVQQRREQISTLLRDAAIEEDMVQANKMQLLYDLVGQEVPYYLQRP